MNDGPRGRVAVACPGRHREEFDHGFLLGDIATRLVVTEHTTKTHAGHILDKLDLRDRVQAMVFSYESGLVPPGD